MLIKLSSYHISHRDLKLLLRTFFDTPQGKLSNIQGIVTEMAWGEHSQKNCVVVCRPLPKTSTLFMTKICDIHYPIYDLTKNWKLYL